MEVKELKHPLIEHKLAILRDKKTGTKEFRELVSEIAMFLCYEAMEEADLEEVEIETPITKFKTGKLNEDKYAFVPILRAGMGMLEGITRVIPNAKIGHIGMYRDEETFEPVNYFFKVPKHIEEKEVIILDPMLATVQKEHPDVQIYCAHIDDHLNENKYIVPGLGDAGDRIFGTK